MKPPSGCSRRGRWLLVLLLCGVAAPVALADAAGLFKKGIAAAELGNWRQATDWFRQAIAEDAAESSRRVLITGAFSRPYLPHFFLGWSLSEQGDARCGDALAALAESERQGVISGFARQLEQLRAIKSRCLDIVMPAALEQAEAALTTAEGRASALAPELQDPTLETERRAALASLEQARRHLEIGRGERDLEKIRGAQILAEEAEGRLERLSTRPAANVPGVADGEPTAAASEARRAVAMAEAARRSLAAWLEDPAHREAREQYPNLAMPQGAEERLAALRRELAGPAEAEAYRRIRSTAEGLEGDMRQVERLAVSLAAAMDRRQPAPPPPRPREVPSSAAQTAVPQTAPPPPTIDPRVRQLVEAAEALLTRIAEEPASRLLLTQRDRLRGLVAEVGEGDPRATSPGLLGRLTESYVALQVLAGADALFAGRAGEADAILSGRALPSNRLGAHGLLLRAAARFALSRRGGDSAIELRHRAARDIHRCRALEGTFELRATYFSAAFRDFYGAQATEESAASRRQAGGG